MRTPFLPTSTLFRAMAPTTLVVVGLRGSGKTSMVQALLSLTPTDAWGELPTGAPASAKVRFVAAQVPSGAAEDEAGQRLEWLLQVVQAVHAALPELSTLPGGPESTRRPHRRQLVAELLSWLDKAHAELVHRGQSLVLLYDEPEGALGPLFALWLVLGERYRRLRVRFFLRPEAMATARLDREQQHKVLMRTVELAWSIEDLFRLLAAVERPGALPTQEHPIFGPLPARADTPEAMYALASAFGLEESAAERLFSALRGRRGQVCPRDFLVAMQEARALSQDSTPFDERTLTLACQRAGDAARAALALDLPEGALGALSSVTLPAEPLALAEQIGSELLAHLRREALLVPNDEDRLDWAALYRPAR